MNDLKTHVIEKLNSVLEASDSNYHLIDSLSNLLSNINYIQNFHNLHQGTKLPKET